MNMATELKLTKEETIALQKIEAELRQPAGAKAFAASSENLCEKYKALKGSLEVLVKILRKIPGFGAKAAAALEFLMSLANTVCSV